jgi:hypothetical protein
LNDGPNIQHKASRLSPPGFAYEDGRVVGIQVPDIAALEAEAERRDLEAVAAHYRDKLAEFARFTCDVLLSGNPSAEVIRRRAYFYALAMKQPPFSTQTELAAHLGVSRQAISKQVDTFLKENPLMARAWSVARGGEVAPPALVT